MRLLGQVVLRRSTLAALALSLPGARGAGQIIPIRNVPIAQGDQFLVFPTSNFGMGDVSIALADSLLDPFRNPAMGARIRASSLFIAPTMYSISKETGGGRGLPLAVLGRAGPWFGGLAGAVQQLDNSAPIPSIAFPLLRIQSLAQTVATPPDRTHGNSYAFASLGRVLGAGEAGLSVGGSVLWSRLRAVSGADLLYPGSEQFAQSGHRLDLRLGLLREWSGKRSLEILVLHDRFAMSDEVTYLDQFWDAGRQQFVQVPRVEHDRDRLFTTGAHLAYQMPLDTTGWRIGWIATVNLDRLPRIAPDEIVALAPDQGRSTAYNLGLGVSRTRGAGTFGIDAIYEPIRSTTWALADAPVVTATGDTIPVGGRTSENRFRFSNVVLRLGVSRDLPLADERKAIGLELGLAVRSMHYRLDARDYAAGTTQPYRNGWVEWSPSWGLSLRFPDLALRYAGRITNGLGRPGPATFLVGPVIDVAPGSVLVGQTGTLNLVGVTTVTHQISLSLPLR